MKYAVVKSGGKQYRVSEGDLIELDSLKQEPGKISFDQVLLYVDENGVKIGKPNVSVKVDGTLVENKKGDKLRVSKFKSKVRYRKTIGFRSHLSVVKIDKIAEATEKTADKVKTVTKKK